MKSNMLHLRSVVFLFAFFFGSFGDSWGQCITWLGNEYNGDLSNVYVGDPIYFEIQTNNTGSNQGAQIYIDWGNNGYGSIQNIDWYSLNWVSNTGSNTKWSNYITMREAGSHTRKYLGWTNGCADSWTGNYPTWTVNSLQSPTITSSTTAAVNSTLGSVTLNWTKFQNRDVLIVYNTSNVFTSPTTGASYNTGNTIGSGTVAYKGAATTCTVSNLTIGTTYYFAIYTENHTYYSSAVTTSKTVPSTTGNGDWSSTASWGGASLPTSSSDIYIGHDINQDQALSEVNNLSIISGSTLTVATGKQLTINGVLTNNGSITLKSGATIDPGTSYSQAGGGTYNVEQDITGAGGSTPSGRFWYVGSPVASATSGVYDAAGSNVVKGWNEVGNAWVEIFDNSTPLAVGKGYYVRAGTSTTLNFTGGAFNNEPSYTLNLTRTGTTNSNRGFNLVSNPYPSYLDWDGVTRSSGVSSTIWYRTANASNVNVFDTYNAPAGTGTNTNGGGAVSRYIPPMQSFWVFVTPNNTTGTISFDNADRSHYQSGVQGLRSTAQDFPMFLRLNVEQGTNRDQIILYMKPEASSAYDEFDSDKMFLSGTPQLYTKITDKKLVINGMKNNKKQTSVPLFIDIPSTGLFTLHAEEFNVEEGLILLEDKQEQMMQDITLNDTYTFYATSGVCSNRFVIHFKMPNAVPTAQGPSNNWADDQTVFNEVGGVQITSDARGKVVIALEQTEDVKVEGMVQVTDANGRKVYNGTLDGVLSTIQLDVPSGIYYLTVQSGNITEKKKVFIQD
jgi:hypothetical protein